MNVSFRKVFNDRLLWTRQLPS